MFLHSCLQTAPSAATSNPWPTHWTDTLTQLQGMGFKDEGGWLSELVRAKQGNLEQILDALHQSKTE